MRLLLAPLLALICACAPRSEAQEEAAPIQWTAIHMEATPVELGEARVGRLSFRGGIALESDEGWFGGLSGLEMLDSERFLFISDRADWFEGRFLFAEDGTLSGVADVRMAPLRDENGRQIDTRDEGDSEDLTQLRDGRFAVSFERMPRILIYDVNRDGPFGAAVRGPRLAGAERLPPNSSLEAIAADGEGNLIVGAEGGGGFTPIWIAALGAAAPVESRHSYRLGLGFSLTALDRGPEGGYFAVERFYAPVIGARARIVYWPDDALAEEGVIEGVEELAMLAPPMAVDNFEAIAAVRRADGGVRLYIASDDNFSERQRTLIYAFDLESD